MPSRGSKSRRDADPLFPHETAPHNGHFRTAFAGRKQATTQTKEKGPVQKCRMHAHARTHHCGSRTQGVGGAERCGRDSQTTKPPWCPTIVRIRLVCPHKHGRLHEERHHDSGCKEHLISTLWCRRNLSSNKSGGIGFKLHRRCLFCEWFRSFCMSKTNRGNPATSGCPIFCIVVFKFSK